MAILLPTPHREERAPGREEDKRTQNQRQTDVGGGLPCAVYCEGHREHSAPFCQKREMGLGRNGKEAKVKGEGDCNA